MKYRFVDALNNFLLTSGRSDLVNGQFDCHSTIQLELNESPPINVDLSTDDIILWCVLADYEQRVLDSSSYSLLNQLLTYTSECFQPGQPALSIINDRLVLTAFMKEAAINEPQLFSKSLEEFFERGREFRTLLAS
ncbi:InvB/SpaK family type III secretion system chaperone [Enterobacter ludwigii]|jgi:hypothetical protein